MKPFFSFLLLLLTTSHAWAVADKLVVPTAAELGMMQEASVDDRGRKVIRFKDRESGQTLTVTYSLTGEVEQMLEETAGGAPVDRREMHSGVLTVETFRPRHTYHRVGPPPLDLARELQKSLPAWARVAGSDFLDQEWHERMSWTDGQQDSAIGGYFALRAPARRCDPPNPPSNADALLANLSWISMTPGTPAGDVVPIGNNFQLEGCASYPQGGVAGMTRDLQAGLRQGLQCMNGLGPARRMDAARMLAFLQPGYGRVASVQCGATGTITRGRSSVGGSPISIGTREVAQAHTCTSPDFPAFHVAVSTPGLAHDSREFVNTMRQETGRRKMFHEMLHWLGYLHSEGVDVTYLVESCCFDSPTAAYAPDRLNHADSCAMLAENPQPDWTGESYQRRFGRIMGRMGLSQISHNSAISSLHTSRELAPGIRDTSGLMASVMETEAGDAALGVDSHLTNAILGRFALTNMRPAETMDRARVAYDAAIRDRYFSAATNPVGRELVNRMGTMMGDIINGDTHAVTTNWPAFIEARTRFCTGANATERQAIQDAASSIYDRVYPWHPAADQAGSSLPMSAFTVWLDGCNSSGH